MSNNTENNPAAKKLRCINIDCVFNSSNTPDAERNFCFHPNLKVESKFADITIAICSEFRSKKDYKLEDETTLIELKTNEKIKIEGAPDPSFTRIEKVTQDELEQSVKKPRDRKKTKPEVTDEIQKTKPEAKEKAVYDAPVVISSDEEAQAEEEIILTSSRSSNLQVLKRLYQPYMQRGITFSIIFHLFMIWALFITLVKKDETNDVPPQQRIVVVEDIETPKFDPPDMDKPKEEPSEDIGENTKDIRPKITPKNIKPKINRPIEEVRDTSELVSNTNGISDSLKHVTDSLLALMNDTNRVYVPDSLKNFMPENQIGMKLWYPKNWKLTDNRSVNLNLQQFMGVIINTDSLSEDPGAVSLFIQIDDPKHSSFNKTTFKNTFQMDDSLITAFSTDPQITGSKRISYKFFLFTDPTGEKNVYVNSESKQELFEKYKKYIEAIVRSISIITKPKSPADGDNK